MAQAKKKKKGYKIRPELAIITGLIICVVLVMGYDFNERLKGELVMEPDGNIHVCYENHNHDQNVTTGSQALWEFDPNTCRYIEVMDEDLHTVFRMVFANITSNPRPFDTYRDQLDLGMLLNKEKVTTVQTQDGDMANIHYIWREDPSTGERFLFVQSVSESATAEVQRFKGLCYLMLSLTLLLAINMIYWQCRGITNRYHQMRREMEEEMNRL